jgi:tetratricopeptide (TPR) repeat protein
MQAQQEGVQHPREFFLKALLIIEGSVRAAALPEGALLDLWTAILAHTSGAIADQQGMLAIHPLEVTISAESTEPEIPPMPCLNCGNGGSAEDGAEAWLRSGVSFHKKGKLEDAASSFGLSIKLAGKINAKVLINSARLFQKAGIPLASLWCAIGALMRNSEDQDAPSIIALAAMALPGEMRLSMLKCIRRASAASAISLCLAKCQYQSGDTETATHLLDKVKGQSKETAEYKWLKVRLDHLDEGQDPKEMLAEAAFAPGADARICLDCGMQLMELNAISAAERCLAKALSLSQDDASRREILGKFAGFPVPAVQHRGLPLILISQIQRSGGTLLSQLLDDHPQLLVHPHELHIGYPRKWNWPELNLEAESLDWLNSLFEMPLPNLVLNGYQKPDRNPFAVQESFSFPLSIAGLCSGFLGAFRESKAATQRQVLDVYFDAFFDNWHEYIPRKAKYVCGFTPRLLSNYGSTQRYFSDYPDGMLIAVVRDPFTWFESSRRHDSEYQDIKSAIELWRSSTLSALLHARTAPHKVHLMTYEDLVLDTDNEMRVISARLHLDFDDSLLTPTFIGQPILPNSSYAIAQAGVHRKSIGTADQLAKNEWIYIQNEVGALYEETRQVIYEQRKKLLS